MKVAAIIAEYNPFHNGHKYHIEKTKELTGADYIIAIISGNYVQRGTPAIIDKYSRTKMALENGVDLVIELPTCYATASAEYFAYGAVSILNQLGVVDYLCFGSECADIETLHYIANILVKNPPEFSRILNSYLKEGKSFPKARHLALIEYLSNKTELIDIDKLNSVLDTPNNILGIEYIKALIKLDSSIEPITILRQGEGYNSNLLPEDNNLSSASGIRNEIIHSGLGIDKIDKYMPSNCYEIFKENYHKTFPIHLDDFTQIAYYALHQENKVSLSGYLDIDQNIANKIINTRDNLNDLGYYLGSLKSKDITYSRLSRGMLHIILGIKDSNMNMFMSNTPEYARILGFKEKSSELLKIIKKSSNLNIISKLSLGIKKLSITGRNMLELDINSSHLYNKIVFWKYHTELPNEYKQGVIIK